MSVRLPPRRGSWGAIPLVVVLIANLAPGTVQAAPSPSPPPGLGARWRSGQI